MKFDGGYASKNDVRLRRRRWAELVPLGNRTKSSFFSRPYNYGAYESEWGLADISAAAQQLSHKATSFPRNRNRDRQALNFVDSQYNRSSGQIPLANPASERKFNLTMTQRTPFYPKPHSITPAARHLDLNLISAGPNVAYAKTTLDDDRRDSMHSSNYSISTINELEPRPELKPTQSLLESKVKQSEVAAGRSLMRSHRVGSHSGSHPLKRNNAATRATREAGKDTHVLPTPSFKRTKTTQNFPLEGKGHTTKLPYAPENLELGSNSKREAASTEQKEAISNNSYQQRERFTCNVCMKTYSSRSNLNRHRITHTGKKPHVCECGKSFWQSGNLKQHIRTHTGERPFFCKTCGLTFRQNAALSKHVSKFKHVGGRQRNEQRMLYSGTTFM